MTNGLLNNPVEYMLRHIAIVKPTSTVLAEGRGIEHLIRQLQAQEPAIGDIDLNLANQLTLRANAKQIANKQRFEHHGWIESIFSPDQNIWRPE